MPARKPPRRAGEGVGEAPHEPHTILEDGEALVSRRPGQRAPGLEIHLVRGPDEAAAQPPQELLLPALDGLRERLRLRVGQRAQPRQALAMAGEPDGHHGRGRHLRMQAREVTDRALEVRAVIPFGHEHDLGVHDDAGLGETLHARHELAADRGLTQEAVAEVGLHGVDGDVERREALLLDAPQLGILQIRQRDVVAVEEGEAEIVVLDVEALAHALGKLMDEAEDALVRARGDLAGAWRLQLQSQVPARALDPRMARAAVTLDLEAQPRLPRVIVEVDGVAKRRAVDGDDAIARAQTRTRRRAPGAHGGDEDALDLARSAAGHARRAARPGVGRQAG